MAAQRFVATLATGALVLGAIGGCASVKGPQRPGPAAASRPAEPVLDAKARLHLDGLDTLPALPAALESAGHTMDPSAQRHYQAALEFQQSGQSGEAMAELAAAVKADPRSFEPRLALGRAALQSGLFDEAHDTLDMAVSLRPTDARSHYLLGLLGYLRDNDRDALPQLRYALQLYGRSDDRIKPLFYLVQVLGRQGYYQAAVDGAVAFEALLSKTPQSAVDDPRWQQVVTSQSWKIPVARAAALRKLGKPAQAVKAYDAALAMDPHRSEVLVAQAETLIDAGDTAKAVKLAQKVLAADRHNGDALAVLAATLAAEGRMDELQSTLLGMVRAKPSDLLLAQRAAMIFVQFARYDAALDALLLAYDAADDPGALRSPLLQVVFTQAHVPDACGSLATLLKHVGVNEQQPLLSMRGSVFVNPALRSGRVDGASLLRSAGDDPAQLLALAVVGEMTGRPVLSSQAARELLRVRPDDVSVAVMLAERLVEQCRWDEVIAFVTPQIKAHKDEAAFYRLLGMAYDGQDDFKAAMNAFYEALRRDKRDVQTMWQAAQINDRLGQSEPAISIYQVIISSQPDFWPAHVALVRGYLQTGRQSVAIEHVRKLKELLGQVPEVDLCTLMAQTGKTALRSELIKPLLERYGDVPVLLLAMARAYVLENKNEQAVVVLSRLLARQSDDQDGRLLLVTALSRQMEFSLAQQVLAGLLVEHPNRRTWKFAQAELALQAGEPAAAAEILQTLLEAPLENEQKQAIVERLIFAWAYAGQYDKAIHFLREQLESAPRDRLVQTRLLGVLVWANRRGEAIAVLKTWRQAEPDDVLLTRLEAQLLTAQGADPAAAAVALQGWPGDLSASPSDKEMERQISLLSGSLPPQEATAWLKARAQQRQAEMTAAALASAAGRQGQPLLASQLQQVTPSDDVEDLAQQAQWLFAAGQREQVELLLMVRIRQKNPEMYGRVKRMAASYYKELGLDELSARSAEEVYLENKDAARAGEYANDLSYIWSESGRNLPQAEDLARIAVASDPVNAAYLDTLAWVYYKMGRFEKALSLLERAVMVPADGSDPVLYDHLGDARWQSGAAEKAVAAWREAVELYRQEMLVGTQRPETVEQKRAVEKKIESVEEGRRPHVVGSARH